MPHPPPSTDILIVGAGLTGLAIADALTQAGRDVCVIEARDRIGGRILTTNLAGVDVDLGPAWVWPGQPRVAALAHGLGLRMFDQFASGALVFEDAAGDIRRDLDMAPMAGSLRIAGGLAGLTDGLAARIGAGRIHTGARLVGIASAASGVAAEVETGGTTTTIRANIVVLAAPPRLLEASFDFTPHLPTAAKTAMRATPTWMAGHAKIIAVYPHPFWRDAGLNGDAISHRGPLAEIHDASPADAAIGALFGFVGVPADQRRDAPTLTAAAGAQLARLFGPQAPAPTALHLQDWAADPMTAAPGDEIPPSAHPVYGPIASLTDLWDGRLHIVSSELAPTFGGFIEGALEAAEIKAAEIIAL